MLRAIRNGVSRIAPVFARETQHDPAEMFHALISAVHNDTNRPDVPFAALEPERQALLRVGVTVDADVSTALRVSGLGLGNSLVAALFQVRRFLHALCISDMPVSLVLPLTAECGGDTDSMWPLWMGDGRARPACSCDTCVAANAAPPGQGHECADTGAVFGDVCWPGNRAAPVCSSRWPTGAHCAFKSSLPRFPRTSDPIVA
jgi:hypothetical protein